MAQFQRFIDYWAVNSSSLFQTANGGLGLATDSTTARTISTTDNMDLISFTNGTGATVTLPNNMPVAFQCSMVQMGTGQITLSAASGATINSFGGLVRSAAQYSVIYIVVTSNSNGTSANYLVSGRTA